MTTPRPPEPLGLEPTFGFGDRLGSATSGHLAALASHGQGILPIFAQQSIREMTRTARTPADVISAAAGALAAETYTGRWGADADHLKTTADVDITAAAGFVFFTIDPSDYVDPHADEYPPEMIEQRFAMARRLAPHTHWVGDYSGRTIHIDGGPTIVFDELTVRRSAVKYGAAISYAIKMGLYIDLVMKDRGSRYEIELSVDETPQPTTLAEHYIIAEQCLRVGMQLVSLAPRYIGDFEKGIDYKGDVAAFTHSLVDHAAIARALGPYKLSLHSGSDKLSIYKTFARTTRGMFHVKTAGTSYLEALRVVARHDGPLMRRVIDFSRGRFERDRATYHIAARMDRVPEPSEISDDRRLEQIYLDENDGRQILHVTFGSALTDGELGPAIQAVLRAEPTAYREVLLEHFGKHLDALVQGLRR